MDKLFIVIPAYNEELSIESVVREWYALLTDKEDGSALAVNYSGSTDGTEQILKGLQKELRDLRLLNGSQNDYGHKVLDLYRYAVNAGADYIFETDSDGQTRPEEFPPFWEKRKEYDEIIGHRRLRGDGKTRKFVSGTLCCLLRLFYGIRVPDANTPFRLMTMKLLEKYLKVIPPDYSMPNILLTALPVYRGEKVGFGEITFKPREKGSNKMNYSKIVKVGFSSVGTFLKCR